MLLSIPFPSWLTPEIIPGTIIRWYGLMYVVAFGIAYSLFRKQVRERHFPLTEDAVAALFTWGILGLLLGARIFATIVYETSDIYRRQPWLIFWPFRNGQFTGLQGMSYHGGVIGCVTAVLIYLHIKHFDKREICDMVVAAIPLGYTFGRLGNFINAELQGRVTTVPWGMIFPNAQQLSTQEPWVRAVAEKTGIDIAGAALVNLPRHPSQLYEALFEGVVLWAFLWFMRNRKPFKGFIIALYLAGYGLVRFIIEYFREPDSALGYRLELIPNSLPVAQAHPLLSFSTGQILNFMMIIAGIIWAFIAARLPDRQVIRVYPDSKPVSSISAEERQEQRKNRRRLRKKLR
ncbi:MAG: prolipoprotein diacylglyceryl transferase [Spirochaetaceae bacterium]|jgi:phosphatidylglycerol:prolipoprotein diacylglycerol transferase|nr:prolipoprotein diacylglyceryl transferase [Spirochaetaceae bacterium]